MVTCRICNSKDKDILFQKYGFDISQCGNCKFVYTDFQPTQKFLKEYYSKNYFIGGKKKLGYDNYGKEEISSRLTSKKRIKYLKLKSKGRVLDVGCAYGFFLSEIPDSWNKYGLEISKFAYKKAININPSAEVKNQVLTPQVFGYKKFDLITLWDVIEHVDSPGQVTDMIYHKLKKGGKLALSTGDVDSMFSHIQGSNWHLYTPPQHLNFFSPNTIRKLLGSIGFKTISIVHPPAYYPASYIAHKLYSLYNIKLPFPKVIEKFVFPVNLGDIMLVTATK